jgi:CheY-like chemotaxis protein
MSKFRNMATLWISKESPPYIVGAAFDSLSSGKEGLQQWQNHRYGVVLVEVGILTDGMSGFEFVRNLRQLSRDAVIYLMSTNPSTPDSMWAQRLRANGLIRRNNTEIVKTLRDNKALDLAAKAGQKTESEGITARLMGLIRRTDPPAPPPAAKAPPKQVRSATPGSVVKPSNTPNPPQSNNATPSKDKPADDTNSSVNRAGDAKLIEAQKESIQSVDILLKTSDNEKVHPPANTTSRARDFSLGNAHDLTLENFFKLGLDGEELDRQFAWELYAELSTRSAVTGKPSDPTCTNTQGELYYESFASLIAFCKELRSLLRSFPASEASKYIPESGASKHLGALMLDITCVVLNPFLDKWRQDYTSWWEFESNKNLPATERQQQYPKLQEMLVDWRHVKKTMRAVQIVVAKEYNLM